MRISELSIPFANAQNIFQRLKSKYPILDAHIVVSTQYGQTEPTPDGFRFLEHIPSSFVDSLERKEALILFDTFKDLNRRNRDLKNPVIKNLSEQCRNRLSVLLMTMEIMESTQLQLRFGELDYDLIALLQKDPLVDQSLTPQSRGSIKIVLGTLSSLRRKEVNSFDVPKISFDPLKRAGPMIA